MTPHGCEVDCLFAQVFLVAYTERMIRERRFAHGGFTI